MEALVLEKRNEISAEESCFDGVRDLQLSVAHERRQNAERCYREVVGRAVNAPD